MFGKVNVLLLAVFGTILGVQLFWNWDAPTVDADQPVAATSVTSATGVRDYKPSRTIAPTTPYITTPKTSAAETTSVAPSIDAAPKQTEQLPSATPAADVAAVSDAADQPVDETAAIEVAAAPARAPEADLKPSIDEEAKPLAEAGAAIAEEKAAKAPQPAPASVGLLVTYAEALSIRFHGYTEISGTYRVNDDETVSIPVIDRISVAGLSGAELETVLAQKVFELTGRRSDVTIEVERYQPVFVSGIVARPGSFAWRRNMTVMHAVALAGGLYRSPERQKIGVGLIDAKFSIERTLADLKRLMTRMARLKAERDGAEQITIPERLIKLAGETEAQSLIETEQTLLVAARSAAALELDAIEASLRAARDEVVRLHEFSATLKAKMEERGSFIERMTKLEDRGYVSEERMTELRTSIIDLETKMATVRVSISQAEAARLRLERDRIKLVQTRQAQITEELVKLEGDIDEKLLAYHAARARRTEIAAGQDAASLAADNPEALITYSVVRRTAFGIETIAATPFDKLLPGDIVMVATPRLMPDEAAAPSVRKFASAQ